MTDLSEPLRSALSASYAIDREIGRGGMATVYLARDLKHDRNVAVKVLNPELGAVLGVERFLSEIKVTANLQHPNLLPLFDSGNAGGQLYYVMPFVEGESLRARLDRERQLPIDEAVRITIAIANALDYAHGHGVIHRDLKPENILMQHGQPVIADFGIALAISNAGGARVTQTGLSLGTPQYMSPEQATGDRVIDGRSDIYSLGAILYEMLTGEPPHVGGTVQATIAKVLTDPLKPVRSYRDTVPVQIELAVAKALAKLPADRYAQAAGFVRALEGDRSGLTAELGTDRTQPSATHVWTRHPATVAAGAVILALSGLSGWLMLSDRGNESSRPAARTVRFSVALPRGGIVPSSFGHQIAVSPDGNHVAYFVDADGGRHLWLRDVAQGTARRVGEIDGSSPTFSPDGRWLVFRANLSLAKLALSGGEPQSLFGVTGAVQRIAFYGTDSIIFSNDGAPTPHLWRASLSGGGAPERLLVGDSSATSAWQQSASIAPDGKTLFFVSGPDNSLASNLAFTTLQSRRITVSRVQAIDVIGFAAGRVIYVNDAGAVMAVGFDLKRHEIVGQPVATGESVLRDAFGAKAYLNAMGDLAFIDDFGSSRPMLVGGLLGPTPLLPGERKFIDLRYSPDGKRVALTARDGGRSDIWIYTAASGSLDRVAGAGRTNDRVEWSPDGKRVVYRSDADGATAMWWQPIDGSGPPERLTPKGAVNPALEGVITPDGRTLVYRVDTEKQLRDIYSIPIGGTAAPDTILATPFDELAPRLSPDGRWMAYVSNESGRDEIYVRPFPGPGGRAIVSVNGGGEPLWSSDQKRIFYRSGQAVVAASVTLGATPSITRRDTAAVGNFVSLRFHPTYDIAPNGRLLMLQTTDQQILPTVVLNWSSALAERLGPVTP